VPPIEITQHTDHLTAWLAFIGAIIVASIAAVTAQWRLRAHLGSEERRHREQLEFDRAETDRAELRRILDDLAKQLLIVENAATAGRAKLAIAADADLASDDPGHYPTWDDQIDRFADELVGQIQRLSLRLGPEGSDLVRLATKVRTDAVRIWIALLDEGTPPGKRLENVTRSRERIVGANNEFVKQAVVYTQAQLLTPAAAAARDASADNVDGRQDGGMS
jgi:hypothetical protein